MWGARIDAESPEVKRHKTDHCLALKKISRGNALVRIRSPRSPALHGVQGRQFRRCLKCVKFGVKFPDCGRGSTPSPCPGESPLEVINALPALHLGYERRTYRSLIHSILPQCRFWLQKTGVLGFQAVTRPYSLYTPLTNPPSPQPETTSPVGKNSAVNKVRNLH